VQPGENVGDTRTRKDPGLIKIINPMNYMLLIAETQADFDRRGDPARAATLGEAWKAYSDALRRAGVFVRGSGLHPPQTATTVRVRDGKRRVQDGPFAESKELIGSVIVIDVPNLDEALEWAARCPVAAWGAIEVPSGLARSNRATREPRSIERSFATT
jgi:hypothetical protein